MWTARAPSNIALIKYMGKSQGNRPANPSISYTLDHLISEVRIEEREGGDGWLPLKLEGHTPEISDKGQGRFLDFFAELKREFHITGFFSISSGNNFPSDCGLASSASSFAALTKAAFEVAKDRGQTRGMTDIELSRLTRRGSGSSCRSLFTPWAIWHGEGAEPIELPVGRLLHMVAVVDAGKKEVSSSEAHARVAKSSLFADRTLRAEKRLGELITSFRAGDWRSAYEICWQEFWDMHALFETSAPPFGYMTPGSLQVLEAARRQWDQCGDGPIVTMDAGPNVHFLYRLDQTAQAEKLRRELQALSIRTIISWSEQQ